MITEFHIKSPDGPTLRFEKDTEYMDIEGWGTFIVSLGNAPVGGEIKINDLEPNRWSEYFEDLAKYWRGWKEEKKIESIEGDLILKSTSDSFGHVSVRIELKANQGGADWFVAGTLMLEAGSLDTVAKSAKKFFNYKYTR